MTAGDPWCQLHGFSPCRCREYQAVLGMAVPAYPFAPLPVDEERARLERDHRRYEYLRRLNVRQFKAIFLRAMGPERFDDIIDACIAGCTPGCREGKYPGCAHCMSPPPSQGCP